MATKREPHATNGRKGGFAVLHKYGPAHYRAMALANIAKNGVEACRKAGKLGGERYNQRYVAGGLHGSIHPDDEVPY